MITAARANKSAWHADVNWATRYYTTEEPVPADEVSESAGPELAETSAGTGSQTVERDSSRSAPTAVAETLGGTGRQAVDEIDPVRRRAWPERSAEPPQQGTPGGCATATVDVLHRVSQCFVVVSLNGP